MRSDTEFGSAPGRILDESGEPVGTFFPLAGRIAVTAWQVLDDLRSGHAGALVDVDPAGEGERVAAQVVAVDPAHDIGVLRLPAGSGTGWRASLFRSDAMSARGAVTIHGAAEAAGSWAGSTTREGEDVTLGRVESDPVLPGTSGAPVLDAYGLVVGMVSGRYNRADGWAGGSLWVVRAESLVPVVSEHTRVDVRDRVLSAPARTAATEGAASLARRVLDGRRPRSTGPTALPATTRYRFPVAYDARVRTDLLSLGDALLRRVTDADPALLHLRKSRAVVGAVADAVTAVGELVVETDGRGGFDFDEMAGELVRRVRSSSDQVRALSHDERIVVQELLACCCVSLVEHAIAVVPPGPVLVAGGRADPSRVRRPPEDEDRGDAFRELYLRDVAGRLEAVTVMGLGLNRGQKGQYRLSSSYVNLSMQLARSGPPGTPVTEAGRRVAIRTGLSVEDVLRGRRLVLIEGPAGAGKTTLLRRLALYGARGEPPKGLPELAELVPFLLPARNLDPRRPPRPEAFVGSIADYEGVKPHGWATQLLRDGGAIVLIDGLDEVEGPFRDRIVEWAERLTESYPRTRFVITSRPATMSQGLRERLVAKGFTAASIDPMTPRQVDDFIEKWHEEASAGAHDVRRAADALRSALLSRRDLQRLATTPLLCAMLCALSLNADRWIPRGRTSLYQESLAVLLERRDRAREISTFDFDFDHNQVEMLLRRIAYRMTTEGIRWVHREIAMVEIAPLVPKFRGAFAGGPPTEEQVLEFLVERCGLLQEPTVDTLEFVHPSFQDYLAAAEITSHNHVELLATRIDDPLYHDVIAMAVGRAAQVNEVYFRRLLARLLQLAEDRQRRFESTRELAAAGARSPESARDVEKSLARLRASSVYVWFLLSAAIADVGYVEGDVEHRIQEVTRDLLPPSSIDDARMLAGLGSIVLDPLGEVVATSSLSEEQAVATVLVATMISGQESLPLLRWFAGSSSRDVRQSLLNGINHFQHKEQYAAEILAYLPAGPPLDVALDDARDLAVVSRVASLGRVSFNYECTDADLARIPPDSELRELDLSSTDVGSLVPLSPLRQLTSLDVSDTLVANLAPLAGLDRLERLTVSNAHVVDVRPLAALTNLRELDLAENTIADITPIGSCVGLTALDLSGTRVSRLEAIGDLPALEELVLFGTRIRSLTPLSGCRALRSLDVGGTAVRSVQPLAHLPVLEELRLESTAVRDLTPLSVLPKLRKVVLDGSESVFDGVADLRSMGVEVLF